MLLVFVKRYKTLFLKYYLSITKKGYKKLLVTYFQNEKKINAVFKFFSTFKLLCSTKFRF